MATHSSILAWKIPWTEEPGRLQSMGTQRVRHDWQTSLSFLIFFPVWCTTAFRILVKPLHLRSMLRKSMRHTKNCNACSQYCSTERAQLPSSFPQQYLSTHCATSTSKVELFGLKSFALSTIFIWPLIHRLPLFQASWQVFAGKMLSQPAGGRKCFPRVHRILKHRFLFYRNKLVFSLAKMCWL